MALRIRRYVQLEFLGWGNAKNASGSVTCQHGPRECELNRALNCAQRLAASQQAFFSFLYCLESTAFGSSSEDVLRTCSGDAGVDKHALQDCTYGSLGKSAFACRAACQIAGITSATCMCTGQHLTAVLAMGISGHNLMQFAIKQGRSWSGRRQLPRRRTSMCRGSWWTAFPWVSAPSPRAGLAGNGYHVPFHRLRSANVLV